MSRHFGERLRQLRRGRGLRIADVAAALAVSPAALSRIERGLDEAVDDDFIRRAAQYFELNADELFLTAARLPADLRGILQQHPAESALLLREHFGVGWNVRGVDAPTHPNVVITALVEWAIRTDRDVVLDPCCGDGAVLAGAATRLLALGATPAAVVSQLHGYDEDAEACARSVRRLRELTGETSHLIRRHGFLRAESRSRLPFARGGAPAVTAVIGAIGSESLSAVSRRHARAVAAEAGVELPDTAAPWAAAIVHAAACARADGRLALLVPAGLLHAQYAGAARSYLAQLFRALTIVTFERPLPTLGEAVALLGDADGEGGVRTLRIRDARELTAAQLAEAAHGVAEPALRWSAASLPTPGLALLRRLRQQSVVRRLGDLVRITPGIVTGANRFFLLNAEAARAVNADFLQPALTTASEATGLIFHRADWDDVRAGARGCFLLTIPPEQPIDPVTRAYLERGERDGIAGKATCRRRPQWYQLPTPVRSAALLTHLCRRRPRMLLNEAGVTHTNALHSVQPHADVNMAALTASFLSTATLLGCEQAGRHYGTGVLQLEPAETMDVWIPYPPREAEPQFAGLLPELDALWRSKREADAIALVDEAMMKHLNVDRAVVAELQHCYRAEYDRRRGAPSRK
ncbi:MAG TPA: helix-turn-helix domain-containing protein [Candidatus Binatia bacterium]|nr:helix-turn-helix domain-containing protein [Candidatus Binatia bacterium]